jgi:hypothetical protein
MKERPILFSALMVRALLNCTKSQTRRIVKPQPEWTEPGTAWTFRDDGHSGPGWYAYNEDYPEEGALFYRCPYGIPGDRLWVRESFCVPSDAPENTRYVAYMADACEDPGRLRWKPSIHMPRWASRILLEITGVRVERLQAISEADARAEGITDGGCLSCGDHEPCGCADPKPDARDSFCRLWQSINGEQSWHANPWVWVVEFKRVMP